MGAVFEDAAPVEDGRSCRMEHPVRLRAVADGVTIEPEALLRCETALALAGWAKRSVAPALATARPSEALSAIHQASAYVCRNRNNAESGKISEHAFGNAVDIAAFELKSGETIRMRPAERDPSLEAAFLRTVTAAACLHFSTVLGAGSDAAHQDHLHLDIKARRGGYRYCR